MKVSKEFVVADRLPAVERSFKLPTKITCGFRENIGDHDVASRSATSSVLLDFWGNPRSELIYDRMPTIFGMLFPSSKAGDNDGA